MSFMAYVHTHEVWGAVALVENLWLLLTVVKCRGERKGPTWDPVQAVIVFHVK